VGIAHAAAAAAAAEGSSAWMARTYKANSILLSELRAVVWISLLLLLLLLQARQRKHMVIAALIGCVIIALALGLGLGLGLKPAGKKGETQKHHPSINVTSVAMRLTQENMPALHRKSL
jgi:hypothetical protein